MASIEGLRYRVGRARQAALAAWVSTRVDFDPAENLYIFSDPRGGSTWFMELLKKVPSSAVLWEPLHPRRGARPLRRLGFEQRAYIAEDREWHDAREAFERVFRGHTLSNFLCHSPPSAFLEAERMVLKLCRGSGTLPWLTRQFAFKYAPVHFVRHPMAVAASQIAFGAWDYEFIGYDDSTFRPGSVRERHADFLATVTTKPEHLVVEWCIGNADTLTNARAGTDWITLHYESLLLNPEEEVARVFGQWGLEIPARALEGLQKPSSTSRDRAALQDATTQLTKWESKFSPDEIDAMARVLDYFGVEAYTTAPLPQRAP